MALVQDLEQARGAGDAGRAAADHRVPEAERFAVGAEPVVGRRLERGAFAGVEAGEAAERGIPVKQEAAAAEAGALRLDEVEHDLDRDCGIGGRASGGEHVVAHLGREGMGGGDHEVAGEDRRALGQRGRGLGLDGRVDLRERGGGGAEEREGGEAHGILPGDTGRVSVAGGPVPGLPGPAGGIRESRSR